MSQEAVERFLGRIITDERFRERAKAGIEQSCISEGYLLSAPEFEHLEKLDFRLFSYVGATLDDAIRRN
ncbi:hypothetical protein KI809_09785 [Geobacter pelophilus]|uniref:Nif11 domain-containing protein n=1 Tax=Geoanaerobacter pelophilus TaxID=60036 RepID=A0AAW4L1J9_9BACT|nr:Os1348 family NHLP clan protein [Geoanaerobacter pelophilus]MBT0664589.1 hypothetical protein [Geoanaerobacter pelophilus]